MSNKNKMTETGLNHEQAIEVAIEMLRKCDGFFIATQNKKEVKALIDGEEKIVVEHNLDVGLGCKDDDEPFIKKAVNKFWKKK